MCGKNEQTHVKGLWNGARLDPVSQWWGYIFPLCFQSCAEKHSLNISTNLFFFFFLIFCLNAAQVNLFGTV